MSPDEKPSAEEEDKLLFDETSSAAFEVLRRRLLRLHRFRTGAMLIMIGACFGFGALLLYLADQGAPYGSRGVIFLILGGAAILLYRGDLERGGKQATQTIVVREGALVLRNLPPSRRPDVEIRLKEVERVDLLSARRVGRTIKIAHREAESAKTVEHYCHLVVDRARLKDALVLALGSKVEDKGWSPR
jgi:hypothetical protein